MANKTKTKTETKIIKPTIEDKLLGAQENVQIVKVVDYLSIEARYNVKIHENGREMNVNGREIGTFLGQNSEARKALKEGQTNVVINDDKKDVDGKFLPLYTIEVIK